jgi:hypothetical protein
VVSNVSIWRESLCRHSDHDMRAVSVDDKPKFFEDSTNTRVSRISLFYA